jgi:trimeric autotransporter adhesin
VELCLALTLMLATLSAIEGRAAAQTIVTTQVLDTVYLANGTAATGTVLISWPSFTTAGGSSVPAGSTSVTIGTGGAFSVQLVPNAGSTPMGSYYTVVYHLGDGSVTREYWVVPAQVGSVTVGAIRSSVLPTSVAMQTVSKSYVDTAIAAAITGHPADTIAEPYVLRAGDTMTGPLVLPADPTAPLQAAEKQYVDAQVAAVASGLNQKVSTLPSATQTVVQPTGTNLAVNILNGVEQASQYVSGAGNNGIANATASPDCANGCTVVAEPNYASTETASPATWNSKTDVIDQRAGATFESSFNPAPVQSPGVNSANSIHVVSTQNIANILATTGIDNMASVGLSITGDALAGGSNVNPTHIQGTIPYFKTTYSAMGATGTNNTIGQHILIAESQDCYGVGDCLMGGLFMRASGGARDETDEGSHPFDLNFVEDPGLHEQRARRMHQRGDSVVSHEWRKRDRDHSPGKRHSELYRHRTVECRSRQRAHDTELQHRRDGLFHLRQQLRHHGRVHHAVAGFPRGWSRST